MNLLPKIQHSCILCSNSLVIPSTGVTSDTFHTLHQITPFSHTGYSENLYPSAGIHKRKVFHWPTPSVSIIMRHYQLSKCVRSYPITWGNSGQPIHLYRRKNKMFSDVPVMWIIMPACIIRTQKTHGLGARCLLPPFIDTYSQPLFHIDANRLSSQ